MPILEGMSKKIVSKNISELVKTKPGKVRAKAIATIAKKTGVSKKTAQRKQAIAIALSNKKK